MNVLCFALPINYGTYKDSGMGFDTPFVKQVIVVDYTAREVFE
jgi:hypothetical protein